MGNKHSSSKKSSSAKQVYDAKYYQNIKDRFSDINDITEELQRKGLESSNLIIGVDYTKSNEWQGERTFGGQCLHYVDPSGQTLNPYQYVLNSVGATLEPFDDDHLIPVYGFGDKTTGGTGVFSFKPNEEPCHYLTEAVQAYNQITPSINLSGPTNFAPIVRKAIEIVRSSNNQYHILILIADGQVSDKYQADTRNAIVEASQYPLSIVMIGVGDGPWNEMEHYDDELKGRRFDNFQFVNYQEVYDYCKQYEVNFNTAFAIRTLMEIPDQYQYLKQHQMIGV